MAAFRRDFSGATIDVRRLKIKVEGTLYFTKSSG
jgi:hypothetical protein